MLTTCPECQTTFRVTQEHLGLRRGLVRCGHCGVVFNAYDSLLAELVTPPAEPEKITRTMPASAGTPPPHAVVAEPRPPSPSTEAEAKLATETETEQAEETGIARDESAFTAPETQPPPRREIHLFEADEEAAARTTPPPSETSESILLSELPTRIPHPRRERPPHFGLKLATLMLLATLLPLQVLVFLRADIASALPGMRPLLTSLCEPFDCVVPLPRQLDKTAIAASSLEHDTENRSRSRLSLLLANHSGQAQTWPHIVLVLTDMRDIPVAQRVFTPGEYLAGNVRQDIGMAANEEQEIRLDLDTGTLAATGYALDLVYR